MQDPAPFGYEYDPGRVRFGRGCVARVADDLDDLDLDRALVVTGTNVGRNRDVMDPVEAALGDRLAGVFAETTPEKSFHTAYDALDAARDCDADVLVGVGAGSSLDIATVASTLHADPRPIDVVQDEVRETGSPRVPTEGLLPLVFVPTTLAGADLSAGCGIGVPGFDGERTLLDHALTMTAGYYDPNLFATTPMDVLVGSAMNGFDKGIEATYSRHADPITTAAAVRGLRSLSDALPALRSSNDPGVLDRVVLGNVLAQFGVTVPGATKLAIVHAFGHGLRHRLGVQQGVAHGLVAPHALRYVLEHTDAGVDTLAEAFDVRDAADPADAIVAAVTRVRDGLDLPTRVTDVADADAADRRTVAELTYEDGFMRNNPADLDPTIDDLEGILRAAW